VGEAGQDPLPPRLSPGTTDIEAENDVFRNHQVSKQSIGLEHHGKMPLGGWEFGDVLAINRDLAGTRRIESGDPAQNGGLPQPPTRLDSKATNFDTASRQFSDNRRASPSLSGQPG
jgi:hypothetical protein